MPPTFCLCFAFIGINFWGMLHHVCDVAYDETMYGPIKTRKCRSTNWLINYANGNTKWQVMWTYHEFLSKPHAHASSSQPKRCWSQINQVLILSHNVLSYNAMKSVSYQTSKLLKMLLRGETNFLFRSLRHSHI